jgi:transcriptional regulator with XRE-family HTH domain
MATNLGKFLRKIRIDNDEMLKDMADKLGVTSSFLSAVENGKRKMPGGWSAKICSLYQLTEAQISDFNKAIAQTEQTVKLNLEDVSVGKRELVVSFARKLSDMDDEDLEAIKGILERVEK